VPAEPMQMLASAKDSIERKLNRGNGYSTVSNSETQMVRHASSSQLLLARHACRRAQDALSDDFYSQQLRSDGWCALDGRRDA